MARKLITAGNNSLKIMRVGVVSEMAIGCEGRQDLEVKRERIKGIGLKVTWLSLHYPIKYMTRQRCDSSQLGDRSPKITSHLLKCFFM